MADYWDNRDTWIAHIKDWYYTAHYDIVTAQDWQEQAAYYYGIADYVSAIACLINMGLWINHSVINVIDPYIPTDWHYGVPEFIDQHCTTTWETIVSAWTSDDFEGRKWTIATIDRMREIVLEEDWDIVWAGNIENQGVPTV